MSENIFEKLRLTKPENEDFLQMNKLRLRKVCWLKRGIGLFKIRYFTYKVNERGEEEVEFTVLDDDDTWAEAALLEDDIAEDVVIAQEAQVIENGMNVVAVNEHENDMNAVMLDDGEEMEEVFEEIGMPELEEEDNEKYLTRMCITILNDQLNTFTTFIKFNDSEKTVFNPTTL